MINAAGEVAVLTISEKLNSVMQMKIADVNEINYLVTELNPDSNELQAYKAKNLTIL
jgi:DeoR family transcriptional regulator, fructose operon transcriptional repressor